MADITNGKAVAYMAGVRATATDFETLYWEAKHLRSLWNSGAFAAEFPATQDAIIDGNTAKPMVSQDVRNLVAMCDDFVAMLEANNDALLKRAMRGSSLPVEL